MHANGDNSTAYMACFLHTEETFTAKNYSSAVYSLCHAVMDNLSIGKQAADQFFSFLLTSLVDAHPSVSGRRTTVGVSSVSTCLSFLRAIFS